MGKSKSKDNIDNFDEKPKAVIEMEENSDEGRARKKQEEKNKSDAKAANKKFIKKYVVFVIILAAVTTVGIYFTIQYFNNPTEEAVTSEDVASKLKAEDSKYAVNSYDETYDENSISIKYYDKNGATETNNWTAQYIQIEGLLNKSVQENINNKLKRTVQELENNSEYVYTNVTANFGNILSVNIQGEDKSGSLNIDLSTGEEIPFEKVFVSSAPLNSLITEGVFKSLAWDNVYKDYEETFGSYDMNKADTSDYEDKALMVINNYKNKKSDIKYYITPSSVIVKGLIDDNMIEAKDYEHNTNISIDFIEHKEDIAIYKRYLTDSSIFEKDNVGTKNIVVFTEDLDDGEYMQNITYGKIEENIFVEEVLTAYSEFAEKNSLEKIKKYLNKLSEEDKQKLRNQISKNTGVFYQKEYGVSGEAEDDYYSISVSTYQATCPIEYFKEEAFKDYAKMKTVPRPDLGMNGFSDYEKDEYPNLKISSVENTQIYIDKDGNFLGNTEEEAKAKTKKAEDNKSALNNTITNDSKKDNNNENVNTNTVNETREQESQEPYDYELENGETITIDPSMDTMAD